MFASTYFPKTYFPGTYWPPIVVTVDAGPTPLRDRQILKRLGALLAAANQFHAVGTAGIPEEKGASAENYRAISMDVTGFSESSQWSEPDRAVTLLRKVAIKVVIHVRDADPDARDDEADRLYCLAANTIGQQSLDRWLIADMCHLSQGRYLLTDGTERRIECTGQIAYLVAGHAGRHVTPDYPL